MKTLILAPKEGSIDSDGRKFRYGTWWRAVRPLSGRDELMPRPDYDIDMLCFKKLRGFPVPKGFELPPGVLDAKHHFMRMTDEIFQAENSIWPFEWNPYSIRMLEAKLQHPFLMIAGHGGSGKCLAPNTRVLKHDGSIILAKDVKVGDVLMGDDSRPRNVVNTRPGRSNMVRITPFFGEPFECNDDHVLTLKKSGSSWKKGKNVGAKVGSIMDITVKDYLSRGQYFKNRWKLFSIPIKFKRQDVEFDPQIYGIWLGDGSTGKPHITCSDKEVEVKEFVTSYFNNLGYRVKRGQYGHDDCPTLMMSPSAKGGKEGRNPFLNFVRESSPDGKKRILKRYLINSRENRMKLLAGIIDSDGHAANGMYYEIASSYEGLKDDIIYLARSLGFRVSCVKRFVKCNGKQCATYRINVCGNVTEIPTLRKKCKPKSKISRTQDCTGFKIEQLGEGDWSGFQVDGNGRYLLGDCIVTHNSEFIALWMVINYLCDPFHTKGLATSITLKSARGKIWGKISECWQQTYRQLARFYGITPIDGEKYLPGKLLAQGIIKYSFDGVETEQAGLELVPGDSDASKASCEKIQGYHRERILAGLDELSALDHSVMNTIESNLFTNPHLDVTGAFNPDSFFDPGGIACTPYYPEKENGGGWTALPPDAMEWPIRRGWCIRFKGSSSPNMEQDGNKYPYLLSRDEYEKQKILLGAKSKEFCKMYEGFWSTEGSNTAIYDENEFFQYKAQEKVDKKWLEVPTPCSFMDPSFAHGGDSAVLAFGLLGLARINGRSRKVLQLDGAPVRLDADIDVKKDKVEQIVEKYIRLNKQRGVAPKHSGIDFSGAGKAMYSLIARDWSADILQVDFGESASDLPLSHTDRRPAKDQYVRKVSEIWYHGKPLIRSEQLKGLTPDVIKEMITRNYETVAGKIKVEPKDKMKERTQKSPDNADAALGLAYLCRERMGLVAAERAMVEQSGQGYRVRTPAQKVAMNLAKCINPGLVYGDGSKLWRK